MGELIDITDILMRRRLEASLKRLNEDLENAVIPEPEAFGWVAASFVNGMPVKYFNEQCQATIGYISGNTEHTYLEYRSDREVFELDLKELALGIETGTL